MLETAMTGLGQFRVLSKARGCRNLAWSGALARFFDSARGVLRCVTAELASGRLDDRSFLVGRSDEVGVNRPDIDDILSNYPLELESPFEETESIAGGLWSGRALFGVTYEDALAKLRFSRGTLDLPIHTHDYSDRFIVVASGTGRFWWSNERLHTFSGLGIDSIPVRSGDVLIFTRGLLHTFSAPDEELLLLSFHSPEIAFTDPRQYTLPKLSWTPRMAAKT